MTKENSTKRLFRRSAPTVAAFIGSLLTIVVSGCAKSDSSGIASSEIVASYKVHGNNQEISCEAVFNVGGSLGTYIELTDGDRVFCSDGERRVQLSKHANLFEVRYHGGEELTYQLGRQYQLIFERSNGSSYYSSVTLPQEVFIFNPVAGMFHRKGEGLVVQWNAAGAPEIELNLEWKSPNKTSLTPRRIQDSGSYYFTGSDMSPESVSGHHQYGDTSASTTITRSATGTQSSSLKGGSITAHQSKTVTFTVVD